MGERFNRIIRRDVADERGPYFTDDPANFWSTSQSKAKRYTRREVARVLNDPELCVRAHAVRLRSTSRATRHLDEIRGIARANRATGFAALTACDPWRVVLENVEAAMAEMGR